MIFLIIPIALLAAGALYQLAGSYRDARRYPAPGRLLDTGCSRLHLNEQGSGSPVVVLESGIAGSSLSWALVQPRIAEFARVCSYDRAGLGWSDACSTPRTPEQMVSELSTLLSRANLPPPYILVGHSFGGLLIRAFAHLNPQAVGGLVFVDPVSINFWSDCELKERNRLQKGAALSRRGAWLARIGLVRVALAALASGAQLFPKLIAQAASGQGRRVMEGLTGEVQKLPPEVWPIVRAHWSRPKCFASMAAHLESLPPNAQAALAMPIPPQIPFIVLSAANASESELSERDSWVRQSHHGQHIRVAESTHWLQLEQPGIVVKAVQDLIELTRYHSHDEPS